MASEHIRTIGDHKAHQVSADPSQGAGLESKPGSIAMFDDATDGRLYLKYGAGDTQWLDIVQNSGSLKLLAGVTITAPVSAVDFTQFSAEYDNYFIVCNGLTTSDDNEDLWLRFSEDGGGTFKTGITYYHWGVTRIGQANSAKDDNDSQIEMTAKEGFGNGVGEEGNFSFTLYNPFSASNKTMAMGQVVFEENNGTGEADIFRGGQNLAATTDAIRFTVAGGTLNSGTFYLYGIKNDGLATATPSKFLNELTTTDATQTTAITVPTTTDSVTLLKVEVLAIGTANQDMATFEHRVSIKNNGGTLSIDKRDIDTYLDDDNWDVSFNIAGTSIDVGVTGVVATTINWRVCATVNSVN